ncbi:MAG: radical SAM protein [Candidatus Woesearchaeota archaeon]
MSLKVGEIFSDKPLEEKDSKFLAQIHENNKTHTVSQAELQELLQTAQEIYQKEFDGSVWFERSIFTNWTCGIADCRYCYLSTKPKLDKTAVRQKSSILAECIICRLMGWNIGYITGGLRVEKTEYMIELLKDMQTVLGYKPRMNYGPYSHKEIMQFKPHVSGLGCAIESFDEKLHEFICPSKPLPSLLRFLRDCQKVDVPNFITIILGIGERKEDIQDVIEKITEYNIDTVQLCFLKPQEKTVFTDIPPPNIEYMAWWCAKLRIAYPKLHIKIALVRDRIADFSLLLQAGANSFSRYFVFSDFASPFAHELEEACKRVNRKLQGNFTQMPEFSLREEVKVCQFSEELQEDIIKKAIRYQQRLLKLQQKNVSE